MAHGIYKPGQGYWTRVLTAVGLGLVILTGANWLWKEMGAVRLPSPTWSLTVAGAAGDVNAGERVALYSETSEAPIGSAVVDSFDETTSQIVVKQVSMDAKSPVRAATRIEAPGAGDLPAFEARITQAADRPLFPRIYLQAGVAGVVIVLGAAATWLVAGTRPKTNEFLIAVDTEMRKVNWSTRKEVLGSTRVVIFVCATIALLLFVVDLLFAQIFTWMKLLNA